MNGNKTATAIHARTRSIVQQDARPQKIRREETAATATQRQTQQQQLMDAAIPTVDRCHESCKKTPASANAAAAYCKDTGATTIVKTATTTASKSVTAVCSAVYCCLQLGIWASGFQILCVPRGHSVYITEMKGKQVELVMLLIPLIRSSCKFRSGEPLCTRASTFCRHITATGL